MDRKFLVNLLEQFMNESALKSDYIIQGKFKIPSDKNINSYIN